MVLDSFLWFCVVVLVEFFWFGNKVFNGMKWGVEVFDRLNDWWFCLLVRGINVVFL